MDEYDSFHYLETPIWSGGPGFGHKPQALLERIKMIKLPLELSSPNPEKISAWLDNMEIMLMTHTFLLIGSKEESQWPLVLERALSSLGKLQMMSEKEVRQSGVQRCCDVVIIDAGAVRDAVGLITFLREQHLEAQIVVATASPTWQRARETLQAGAADYIYKSLDEKQLQAEIRAVLETPRH